jgi:hypothetical protein
MTTWTARGPGPDGRWPPIACPRRHSPHLDGHLCTRPYGHDDEHLCECGQSWFEAGAGYADARVGQDAGIHRL